MCVFLWDESHERIEEVEENRLRLLLCVGTREKAA
jgi:hypothetical protein